MSIYLFKKCINVDGKLGFFTENLQILILSYTERAISKIKKLCVSYLTKIWSTYHHWFSENQSLISILLEDLETWLQDYSLNHAEIKRAIGKIFRRKSSAPAEAEKIIAETENVNLEEQKDRLKIYELLVDHFQPKCLRHSITKKPFEDFGDIYWRTFKNLSFNNKYGLPKTYFYKQTFEKLFTSTILTSKEKDFLEQLYIDKDIEDDLSESTIRKFLKKANRKYEISAENGKDVKKKGEDLFTIQTEDNRPQRQQLDSQEPTKKSKNKSGKSSSGKGFPSHDIRERNNNRNGFNNNQQKSSENASNGQNPNQQQQGRLLNKISNLQTNSRPNNDRNRNGAQRSGRNIEEMSCFSCGQKGHLKRDCPTPNCTVRNCPEPVGHTSENCKFRCKICVKNSRYPHRVSHIEADHIPYESYTNRTTNTGSGRFLDLDLDGAVKTSVNMIGSYPMGTSRNPNGDVYTYMLVQFPDGQMCPAALDSCCSAQGCLDESMVEKLELEPYLSDCLTTVNLADSSKYLATKIVNTKVIIGKDKYELELIVMPLNIYSGFLLGEPILTELGLLNDFKSRVERLDQTTAGNNSAGKIVTKN